MSTESTPGPLVLLFQLTQQVTAAELVTGTLTTASRDVIRAYQRENNLGVSGVLDAATVETLRRTLAGRPRQLLVAGRLTHADGSAARGLTVRAADRDLRREQRLADAACDDDGYYLIGYGPQQFARAEKGAADLVVRVLDGDRVVHEPGVLGIIFNAPDLAIVNIVLDDAPVTVETEYEMIFRTVVPLLDDVSLDGLREDDQHSDVTFLAAETGIAAHRIAYFGLAQKVAAAHQLPGAFFFALFAEDALLRAGGATGLRTYVDLNTPIPPLYWDVVLLPADTVKNAIAAAVGELVVPRSIADSVDDIIRRLADDAPAARAYLERDRPQALIAALSPLLTQGTISRLAALADVDTLGDVGGLITALHAEAGGGNTDPDATAMTNVLALANVLGLDGPAIAAAGQHQRITDPKDLPTLAALSKDDWVAALGRGPLVEMHASALVDRMAARYPTVALAANLSRDTQAFAGTQPALSRFFDANPDLDFNTANIDVMVKAQPAADLPVTTLKSMQRVFRLSPGYAQTKTLLDAGITSAAQIHTMGQSRFTTTAIGSGAFTPQQAQVAFNKAVQIHVAATFLAGQMQALPAATMITGVSAPLPAGTLATVSTDFPDFKSLFGTGDICACDECRSVHSAAAYLVDTLQFLKHRAVVDTTTGPGGDQHIAKDVLFKRRPDLGDTDLNCANTNTPLPYLDLVCELLEEAIAPDPGFTYSGTLAPDTNTAGDQIGPVDPSLLAALQAHGLTFTDDAVVFPPDVAGNQVVRDTTVVAKLTPGGGGWTIREMRQTYGTEAELAAAPRYVNQAAYAVLRSSPIAFGLPFDLAHAEAGSYLQQAGVARTDLMRALQVGGVPSDAAIAAEAWGLTDDERDLIVTPNLAGQQTIWHTAGAPSTDLANVATFVTRTAIAYTDLTTLLTLAWLNPGGAMTIKSASSGCDLTLKTIDGLDDDALDRFHRFIRLWRATGWTPTTLERVIRAPRLGNGTLDDNALIATRALQDVADRLQLTVDAACDLYADLPWLGDGSRYAAVYLNTTAVGTVPDAFTPAQVTASGATTPLSTYRTYIALCLGITEAEFDALAATLPMPAELTLDNLSALYALRTLTASTRLSVSDLLITLDLAALTPLTGPAATIDFLDTLAGIRAANTTPADVRYLIGHEADDLTTRELADPTLIASLTQLQAAYRAARTADTWAAAATDPIDDQGAALTALLATVPGTTTSDVSGLMRVIDGTWADPDVTAPAFVTAKLADAVTQAALTAILGDIVPAPTDAQRITLIGDIGTAVSATRYARDKQAALVTELTTTFSSNAPLVTAALTGTLAATVLSDVLTDDALTGSAGSLPPAVTPAAFDDQFRAMRLINAMLGLAASFALGADQLTWMIGANAALGWLDPAALPYQTGVPALGFLEWQRLAGGVAFGVANPPATNATEPDHPYTVNGLFDLVRAAASVSDVVGYAAALAGWDPSLAADLAALLGLATAAFADPAVLERLGAAVALVRTLGVTVAQAQDLVAAILTPGDAANLRLSLKAGYADTDWLGVLRNIQDRLRERKRDAVVAYLLAMNPALSVPDDLFDTFLIDVEMSACMPTSRIVQAHATVQLFVQRSLMGLEPTCVADVRADDGWAQWDWMAQFRVWEANRKVFLWPENWLIPDVRDDKSELFQALEKTLRQDALTDIAVEDATAGYLEGLDDIAYLEVMATYYQTSTGVMHVFARTRDGDGRTWLHRQFIKERAWTPWETVKLDIVGDHLTAFERNGRLAVAWPVFTIEADTSQQFNLTDPLPSGPTPPPQKRLSIQICVSEFANGRWRAKKVSKNPVRYPSDGSYTPDGLPDVNALNFFVTDLGAVGQSIVCVEDDGEVVGAFALTGCKGYPEPAAASGVMSYILYPRYTNTDLETEKHILELGEGGSELTEIDLIAGPTGVKILEKTPNPGRFEITHPMQFTKNDMLIYAIRLLLGGSGGVYTSPGNLRGEAGRYRVPLPLGTFMPYFYGDYDRGYVIVPGLYPKPPSRSEQITAGSRPTGDRTYSDLNQLIIDITALARTYLAIYESDKDLPALIKTLVADPEFVRIRDYIIDLTKRRYGLRFENFYHPLVCSLRMALDSGGVDGLMRRDVQLQQSAFDFQQTFSPTPVVMTPYPVEDIDFSLAGAYSSYNWELFFHLPFEIAYRLSNDQQFDAAQKWLHYIFNPVGVIDPDTGGGAAAVTAPAKYWITKPFFKRTPADYAHELIEAISTKMALDPEALHIDDLVFAVDQWREHPFSPFVVARSRTVAFQIATVKAYVQNLIDWADSQFRLFTRESVTFATQLYLMAEKLLGSKPQIVPPDVEMPTETYNQLEASLDIFGNTIVNLENLVPGWVPDPAPSNPWMPAPISAASLYFCIPPNEDLLSLWDTVADRLFKIRHCMNIDGVEAMLALFAPPIDPGALIRALAAGGTISSVLASLGAPPPYYRFSVLTQKATELVGHVNALGGELLAALEKRDAEKLSQLRTTQEQTVLNAVKDVKSTAIEVANAQILALQKTKAITQARYDYYASRPFMNPEETTSADIYGDIAAGTGLLGAGYVLAGVLTSVPDFMLGLAGFGGSPAANATTGGSKAGKATDYGTRAAASLIKVLESQAAMTATQGLYHRRADDWGNLATLAQKELDQIDQQIATAALNVTMLTDDLLAHNKQIDNAAATLDYLTSKFTSSDLYEWTIGQISSTYFDAYKLAFDTAKKAERSFEHELGADARFINGPYWDSLKKGLMAADALLHDIKRMETAYLDRNKRELELTKHVSLAQIDPGALLTLRNTGTCDFLVPELTFDLDYPGHYFRRIKTVSLSLPSVVGPYTTVNATLSLVSNKYRAKTTMPSSGTPAAKYLENPTGDDRFVYNVGSIQSIATSSGVADSGLFELNFHDERYLPFEGCGAIGRWHLELPADFRQFDYASISDVILHIRYTARSDGGLKKATSDAIAGLINDFAHAAGPTGLCQALSMPEQFPDAWWQFSQTGATSLSITATHLPYWVRGRSPEIDSVSFYAAIDGSPASPSITVGGTTVPLNKAPGMAGVYVGTATGITLGTPVTFASTVPSVTDIVAVVKYTVV